MLFGHIDSKFTGFVQEVTPHEVAHQWWGHTVGWASYHDIGFPRDLPSSPLGCFTAGRGKKLAKDYIEFWDRLRAESWIKTISASHPTDAGPIWMGLRLISPHTENAYQNVIYPKGAYVLEMLRSIMYSPEDQDKDS